LVLAAPFRAQAPYCAKGIDVPAGVETVGRRAVAVFVRSGGTWIEEEKLVAPDGAANDEFGYAVTVSGVTAVVGARSDDTPGGLNAGSVHVFRAVVPVELEFFTVE
jgi:FG-GAP repeat protein